jgi:hypothetical protein
MLFFFIVVFLTLSRLLGGLPLRFLVRRSETGVEPSNTIGDVLLSVVEAATQERSWKTSLSASSARNSLPSGDEKVKCLLNPGVDPPIRYPSLTNWPSETYWPTSVAISGINWYVRIQGLIGCKGTSIPCHMVACAAVYHPIVLRGRRRAWKDSSRTSVGFQWVKVLILRLCALLESFFRPRGPPWGCQARMLEPTFWFNMTKSVAEGTFRWILSHVGRPRPSHRGFVAGFCCTFRITLIWFRVWRISSCASLGLYWAEILILLSCFHPRSPFWRS